MIHCLQSVKPYFFGRHLREKSSGTPEPQRQFYAEAADTGLQMAVSIPFHAPAEREFGALGFASDMEPDAFHRYWREHGATIHLAGLLAHHRIQALLRDEQAQATKLTPRERDCLAWSAAGKTSAETAMILGITERTANAHITNAMRKLNAVTRAQAVAKATYLGLVQP